MFFISTLMQKQHKTQTAIETESHAIFDLPWQRSINENIVNLIGLLLSFSSFALWVFQSSELPPFVSTSFV